MMDEENNPKQEMSANIPASSIGKNDSLRSMSLEELNILLTEVLESEDYIRAIAIRDEIKSRGRN